MNNKLEAKLLKKYPTLYRQYDEETIYTSPMAEGFCCGGGWFDIIDRLSFKLEPLPVEAAQVKEKFGGLRFYVDILDDSVREEVYKYVNEAEAEAAKTCEICGKPGLLYSGGWLVTRCKYCAKEMGLSKPHIYQEV